MTRPVLACLAFAMLWNFSALGQEPKVEIPKGEQIFREFLEDKARSLSLDDTRELSIVQLVDIIMKVQLIDLLGLDGDEAKVLFGEMGKYLDKIHHLKWERGALHYYLRRDLEIEADDDDINRKLESAMDVEIKIAKLIKDMVNAAREDLSVKQQSKLFFFTFDFENDIRELIQQAEALASELHGPTGGKYKGTQEDRDSPTANAENDRE